jgi:hypothetical protein
MKPIIDRKAGYLLANPAISPDGTVTYKHLPLLAEALVAGGNGCFLPFVQKLAEFGWITEDSIVIAGGSGKVYPPRIIQGTDASMALQITDAVTIPAMLYKTPESVLMLIPRTVMPEAPTMADYISLPITAVNDTAVNSTDVAIAVNSVFSVPSTNPLMPATTAGISWEIGTYFKGPKEDNAEHLANVQVTLTQIGEGKVPTTLQPPMQITKKTKDVAPGLYVVLTLEQHLKGKYGPEYTGTIQQVLPWNDLGTIVDTDVTLANFIPTLDTPKVPKVNVKSTLPNGDAAQGAFAMHKLFPQKNRYMLITPFEMITKDGHPYAPTKGFECGETETLTTMLGTAGVIGTGLIQEALGNNTPIKPGFMRDPYHAAPAVGTPIMPPSMASAAPIAPAALPASAPVFAAPIASAPVAVATPAPAIDVASTEAFDLPFAEALPNPVTLPMSAVAPAPVPVAIAPPAPVVPPAPVAVNAVVPAPSAPVAVAAVAELDF